MAENDWLFLLIPLHFGGAMQLALTNAMWAEKMCYSGAKAAEMQVWILHLLYPLLPQLVAGT